jgi:hypothetical protein
MENPDRITVKIKIINNPGNIQRLNEVLENLGGVNIKTYGNSEIQEYLLHSVNPDSMVEQIMGACKPLGFCKWFDCTKSKFVKSKSPVFTLTAEDIDW